MTLKIFPSNNDVGGGKTGSESRLKEWINALISNNFVVSGFDVDSDSGLDVTFNSGEAMIDGYNVIEDAQTTLTMTDDDTNYVYYQLDYDVNDHVTDSSGLVVNTTGSQPSNSVYLASVTTASGSVTGTTDERETGFYNASSILTALKTVDGDGSGLDADIVRGLIPGKENFQINNSYITTGEPTFDPGESKIIDSFFITIPAYKILELDMSRFLIAENATHREDFSISLWANGTQKWESSSEENDLKNMDITVYDNSGNGSSTDVHIVLYMHNNDGTNSETPGRITSWWFNFIIV